MLDKYGVGQDPYCYPGTAVLRNLLGITEFGILSEAERALSEVAAESIEFAPPPYDLSYLRTLHQRLFSDLYDWAGEVRTVDISKDETHFCMTSRIEPEANKLFDSLAKANWFQYLDRASLITASAELFGDLNVVHPFREGNGRAQRILFEHIIVNAGYGISWWAVDAQEWIQANIDAVVCDYDALKSVFERCIGLPISD
jgi:cell filamentation protein